MYAIRETDTFQCGEDLATKRAVKLGSSAREIVYADAADYQDIIGFTLTGESSGNPISCELAGPGKIVEVEASEAIAANQDVILAADGKVADNGGTGTEQTIGKAIDAASGAGAIISIFYAGHQVKDLT